MIEYKTDRVSPSDEASAIKTMSLFGWELYNRQEIYREDSRVVGATIRTRDSEGGGFAKGFMDGWKYGNSTADGHVEFQTAKDITNYVSLTYYRYTEIPHHQELVQLEAEYRRKLATFDEPKKPIKRLVVFIMLALVTIPLLLQMITKGETFPLEDILYLIGFGGLCIYTIFGWIKYFKKVKEYERTDIRLDQILRRAVELRRI